MKKVLALTLVLMLSLSMLVACGGGGPEELTKDTIVGSWSGNVDLREQLGLNVVINATFEFKANGEMVTTLNEDDLKDAVESMFEDDDFLQENFGYSKADLESALALTGQSLDTLIDQQLAKTETSTTQDYTFDGTTLTIDGSTVEFSYSSGVLTLDMNGQEVRLNYKG